MENGYESDYPNPYADSPTPYPALSHNTGTSTQPQTLPNGNHRSAAALPMRSAVPAFTTLDDYFNIGNIGNDRLRVPEEVNEGDQSDDEEGANETPFVRHEDSINGAEDSGDGSESSSTRTPWTAPFFQRYGSGSPQPNSDPLPGFHALPETDTYYTDSLSNHSIRYPGSVQSSRFDSLNSETSTPRGRGRGRGRERGRTPRGSERGSRKRGRGSWKKVIQGTEHADIFRAPRLPRDPTAGRRGRKKGPKVTKHIDPGPEYREEATLANQAYFAEDFGTALEHIFNAIQINPEVYHGHVLFSEILEKQGRVRDAVYAITNGAAVKRDPAVWVQVAERYLAFDGEDQDPNDIYSALKCYQEAVKLDKDNCEIREGKLRLLLETEDYMAARKECKALVRIRPGELDYVRQFASLCNMTGEREDRERALMAYETAFKLLENQSTIGTPDEQWDHLNVYLDLLHRNLRSQQGLAQAKRLARWFLGRKQDTFWDAWDIDDREFDNDNSRRGHVVQFQQGRVTRDLTKYGDGLPLDIRVKMGMFRAQMGLLHQPEALSHLAHLRRLSDQIESYSDMFFDVAECLSNTGFPETAITFYEPMKSHPGLVDEDYWMGIAQCYERVGRTEDAEECYLKAIELSAKHVDAHMALVKLYNATQQRVKAHAMANEVVRLGYEGLLVREKIRVPRQSKAAPKAASKAASKLAPKPASKEGTAIPSHPSKKKRTLAPKPKARRTARRSNTNDLNSLSESNLGSEDEANDDGVDESDGVDSDQAQRLRDQEARIRTNYAKVEEFWSSFNTRQDEEATQRWVQHASEMAKDFRMTKELFASRSRDSHLAKIKNGTMLQGSKIVRDMLALRQDLQKNASNDSDAAMMRSIEIAAPTEVHGITFSEWHRILTTLAIAYAERVDQNKCYDILKNVLMRAYIFMHNPELNNTSMAVCVCCALMFNDNKFVTEIVRQWNALGFGSSPTATHFIAAAGRLSYGDPHFYHRYTQSWAQFAVKQQDFFAMSPGLRNNVDWGDDDNRLDELVKHNDNVNNELDPGLLTMYAHIIGSKQGHNNQPEKSNVALSYLFRALALQPDNIVVNLSIATTYLTMSMRADTENKQYATAQGQAFLYRYYGLRTANKTAAHLQEAEYNMARAWYMIGRMYLAVPAYDRALQLSETVQEEALAEGRAKEEVEDFAREAALALRSVYIAAGNQDAARAITEGWLVL